MGKGGLVDITMQKRTDYLYRDSLEPHKSRMEAIRKAHPEVKELLGPEPLTKYVAVAIVCTHVALAYFCKDLSWPWFLLATYAISGTFQGNLFLAIHEISHNLAFKSLIHNRLLAMFCNLPLVIPYAYTFKPFHMAHHKYQGDHHVDTDIPCNWEAKMTSNPIGKFIWLFFQIFAYALRPCMLKPELMNYDGWLALNWGLCLSFDAVVLHYWGPNVLVYFLAGMMWATSFHPTAGHFISEHYVFEAADANGEHPETYSYYGPLNIIAWNVGYHNEHHDFPAMAWTALPKLRKIAPEFYDTLPQTKSWPGTTWKYLFCLMNGFNRVKRRGSLPAKKSS
jgi:sphingolipid delta-4 desaturase